MKVVHMSRFQAGDIAIEVADDRVTIRGASKVVMVVQFPEGAPEAKDFKTIISIPGTQKTAELRVTRERRKRSPKPLKNATP